MKWCESGGALCFERKPLLSNIVETHASENW